MKRVTIVAGFALAVACGRAETPPVDSAAAVASGAAAPAAVESIISPAEGDSTGSDVTVVLAKQGVTIEPAGGARVEGIGHHHLFLDTVATAAGEVIPPTSAHVIHIGTGDSTYTFKGLSPGPHTIIAVIGYGDHAAMEMRRDTVRFVVRR